jgi:hypothetical protein
MDPLDQKLLHALCGQKFLPLGPKTDFFNSIDLGCVKTPPGRALELGLPVLAGWRLLFAEIG